MTIFFYSTKDLYGEFSNFAPYGIEMDGEWYRTTEHYFQSQKFLDASYRAKIREIDSPMVAARLGRSRSLKMRDDWELIKIDVMRAAVRKKFEMHLSLATMLLETGEEEIIEAAPGDYFWGCGKDGTGQNWLGRILMEVRQELKQKQFS